MPEPEIEQLLKRVESLEREMRILKAALYRMPRLEGFHDAMMLASFEHKQGATDEPA
jgi:hypothetical protein